MQRACQKLIGNDLIYLDTTILIRCIAELFSKNSARPLVTTLRYARELGIKLRTWRPYVDELVAHLKGPVLLEWDEHRGTVAPERLDAYFSTVPALIGAFYWYGDGGTGRSRRAYPR